MFSFFYEKLTMTPKKCLTLTLNFFYSNLAKKQIKIKYLYLCLDAQKKSTFFTSRLIVWIYVEFSSAKSKHNIFH